MSALAIVTNLSPAISFATAIASSTFPVKVVRGNRTAASSGGGRWVTTTTGAPAGWLSPQPMVCSNSRRPASRGPGSTPPSADNLERHAREQDRGTAGTIEQGDTVDVVFSTTMKVSSFCSTWSNDANNQSITADNAVTVSVSNASPDTLTVTSTSCTFNLGSLGLGSTSYVSAAATFKGTGANASTITWNASTHTLSITLGTKTAGTPANVASSAPTYTASGSIQDSAGGTLGNSPYTLAAAKQF